MANAVNPDSVTLSPPSSYCCVRSFLLLPVRTSQVRESAEVNSGLEKLAGYELYDLVVLSGGGSANEVGVIVRVGREDFTVVNNHGINRLNKMKMKRCSDLVD